MARGCRVTLRQAEQPFFPSSLCRDDTSMTEKKKGGMMIEFSPSLQTPHCSRPHNQSRGCGSSTRREGGASTPETPGFTGFWGEDMALPLSSTQHRRVSRKQNWQRLSRGENRPENQHPSWKTLSAAFLRNTSITQALPWGPR